MTPSSNSPREILREYTVMSHSSGHSSQILAANSTDLLFTCHILSFMKSKDNPYTVTIHSGDSDTGPVIGAARILPIHDDQARVRGSQQQRCGMEDMHHTSLFAAQNHYTLYIELPDGGRRDFEWKGTHDVHALSTNANKTARKLDDAAYKIDSEPLKLVEKGTNEFMARLSIVCCSMVDISRRGAILRLERILEVRRGIELFS
jgi:hypothetical protein